MSFCDSLDRITDFFTDLGPAAVLSSQAGSNVGLGESFGCCGIPTCTRWMPMTLPHAVAFKVDGVNSSDH
jgi:hypothetical protein